MSDARSFDTLTVLSAASGILLTDFSQVHAFCEFAAGGPVWTHQLPRVCREIESALLHRRPDLRGLLDEIKATVTKENYAARGIEFISRVGAEIPFSPLSVDEHERIDPLSELAEIVSPDKIVVITADEAREPQP